MRRILGWFLFLVTTTAFAQVSPPAPESRVAGRFVAANYGVWAIKVYSFPTGTGSLTFSTTIATAVLPDGRTIMPFNTNAKIMVGSETVTLTAVGSNCIQGAIPAGACTLTATFSNAHSTTDKISSATFGLQEALNDASAANGGTVVVDSSWTGLGGNSTLLGAATIPSSVGIESEISGVGVITNLTVGTGTPLAGAVINATQNNVGTTTQINVQNTSSDSAASSDLVATADNGTQTTNFTDCGINSSTYSQSAYNSGGADDGYCYSTGNFFLGAVSSGKVVTIGAGGTTSSNVVATFGAAAISFVEPLSLTTPLAAANGGTGATSYAAALSNLLGNPVAGTYSVICASGTSCTYTSASSGSPAYNLGAAYALSGATPTVVLTNGSVQTLTLTGNTTIAFTQPSGYVGIVRLVLTQASGGSDTVTWISVKWPGGVAPVMTSTASAIDIYSCILNGTSTFCTAGQNFE